MTGELESSERKVAPKLARQVLARAAQLDAIPDGALSVTQLGEVASEAGINEAALRAAMLELGTATEPVPGWVRACLLGIPDRATAIRFYWIFVAGLLASPFLPRLVGNPDFGTLVALGSLAFFFGALWSTSRAVKWLDRHGWDRLR